MKLIGKKFAVLIEDEYEDQEFWYPVQRLREEGAHVAIVGPVAGATYRSKHGYPAKSDLSPREVRAAALDGVIVPGGYAPDRMRRHPEMVQLVADAARADKVVAAICHGGWMLCSADVVEGRRVTSFSAIRDDLVNAGAEWVDEEVVRDRNLITSRKPDDLPAFSRTVIDAISGDTVVSVGV
jgi:protease I